MSAAANHDPECAHTDRTPLCILIVADQRLYAMTLEIALAGRGHDVSCSHPARPERVLAQAASLPPGLVLIDLDLGRDAQGAPIEGAALIAGLVADGWTVIAVGAADDVERTASAALAGASAVLTKAVSFDKLVDLVQVVAEGRQLMVPTERRRWLAEQRRIVAGVERRDERLARLSLREREVLDELAAGHRPDVIARAAGVSIATVRSQIRSILGKLEVGSQLEAVAFLNKRHLMLADRPDPRCPAVVARGRRKVRKVELRERSVQLLDLGEAARVRNA